jgi:DNA-3-methyladenine glycosylase II
MEAFSLPLPAHYRAAEVLEFHSRDSHGLAEQVRGSVISKGLMLAGVPALLQVRIGVSQAEWQVQADAPAALVRQLLPRLQRSVRGMLGLDATTSGFEAGLAADDVLVPLVKQQRGLRIPQAATPFEALSWGITGQQISVAAAVSLRRELILLAGTQHGSGLWCHPEADAVAALSAGELRQNKFSQAKAETLLRMARLVADGELPLEAWRETTLSASGVAELSRALQAVKGIGPWTVNYTLLRGYAWSDCLMHGDVAIRRALAQQLRLEARPTAREAEQLLARYAPNRSLAAAHLWASLRLAA